LRVLSFSSYVSEKVTTPSLSPSKNAACFYSVVMPPTPKSSPYPNTWLPENMGNRSSRDKAAGVCHGRASISSDSLALLL